MAKLSAAVLSALFFAITAFAVVLPPDYYQTHPDAHVLAPNNHHCRPERSTNPITDQPSVPDSSANPITNEPSVPDSVPDSEAESEATFSGQSDAALSEVDELESILPEILVHKREHPLTERNAAPAPKPHACAAASPEACASYIHAPYRLEKLNAAQPHKGAGEKWEKVKRSAEEEFERNLHKDGAYHIVPGKSDETLEEVPHGGPKKPFPYSGGPY